MNNEISIMERVVAGRAVGESVAAAEAAGKLIPAGNIQWSLPKAGLGPSGWIRESRDGCRNCKFYLGVMFEHVYRKQRVPVGCATCYKVKVVPRTLRELMASYEVGHGLPYTYKCGLDAPAPYTAGLYGAYFYVHGLPAARAAYKQIRAGVDAHAKMGREVAVFIKRGCTEYEMHCGPSDGYTFSEESKETEAALMAHMRMGREKPATPVQVKQTFAYWLKTAYSLGDETYLDFTAGRRLYPAVVKYPVEAEALEAAGA